MGISRQLLRHLAIRVSILLAAVAGRKIFTLIKFKSAKPKRSHERTTQYITHQPKALPPSNPSWLVEAVQKDPLLDFDSFHQACIPLADFHQSVQSQQLSVQPGSEARDTLFALDPTVTHLNHGSYGAAFKLALQARSYWEGRLEAQPSLFMEHFAVQGVAAAAAEVAAALGARWQDVVPITNATTGVAAVMRSVRLRHGDYVLITSFTYPAVRSIVARLAKEQLAEVVEVKIGLQDLQDGAQLLATFQAALQAGKGRVRVAVLDHCSSFPPFVFPVKKLAGMCHMAGAKVLVDGAHGLGNLMDLDVPQLGCDFYVTNLHKWICTPKGTAVLWVKEQHQQQVLPLVTSHGCGLGFRGEFLWQGTTDPSPWLAVPTSLAVMNYFGINAVIRRSHRLLDEAVALMRAAWGADLAVVGLTPPPTPPTPPTPQKTGSGGDMRQAGAHHPADRGDAMGQGAGGRLGAAGGVQLQDGVSGGMVVNLAAGRSCMVAVELPGIPGLPVSVAAAVKLRGWLREECHIEVPVACWEGRLWVRLSAHLYNKWGDYELLQDVVTTLVQSPSLPAQLQDASAVTGA